MQIEQTKWKIQVISDYSKLSHRCNINLLWHSIEMYVWLHRLIFSMLFVFVISLQTSSSPSSTHTHTHICFEPFLDEKILWNRPHQCIQACERMVTRQVGGERQGTADLPCHMVWRDVMQLGTKLESSSNVDQCISWFRRAKDWQWDTMIDVFFFAIIFLQWFFPFELFEVQIKGIQYRKRLQIANQIWKGTEMWSCFCCHTVWMTGKRSIAPSWTISRGSLTLRSLVCSVGECVRLNQRSGVSKDPGSCFECFGLRWVIYTSGSNVFLLKWR